MGTSTGQTIGSVVPDLNLPAIGTGITQSLDACLAGRRGGVVLFWSSVCTHCVRYDAYLNQLPGNYLNVRLTGVTCNRDAIGARLKLTAGGREQHLVINGGSQFGCLPLDQHFGLGAARGAEQVEIW